jgi:hypothetical protein
MEIFSDVAPQRAFGGRTPTTLRAVTTRIFPIIEHLHHIWECDEGVFQLNVLGISLCNNFITWFCGSKIATFG